MNAIEIEDLTYSYPAAGAPALKDITLHVEQGDFLAVVGNNGCGKSTLCKALNGLIPHFIPGEFRGKVLSCGLDTVAENVGTLAAKVGYVYQDFENQIVRPTALDDASYACLNYAMADYRERGLEALARCGLSCRENDFVWQLSGGQTHLLALAGAAALRPDVLVLDEPIAQLDPRHADQVYGVLRDLNETYGKTVIVIEHHTGYIAEYCRNVALMAGGRILWKLPVHQALRRAQELAAHGIVPPQVTLAAQSLQQAGRLPADILLPITVAAGQTALRGLVYREQPDPDPAPAPPETAIPPGPAEFFVPSFPPAPAPPEAATPSGPAEFFFPPFSPIPPAEPVAEFRGVSVTYRGMQGEPRPVFDGLDLILRRGEKIALVGANGAGKSTLMKLMIGLVRPMGGEVLLFGKPARRIRPEELTRRVSLVYQNPEDMFIKDSIRGDVAYAMQARGVPDWEARTAELLAQFRLTELAERDGRLLSGGQMRRASLAIGVALRPELLLLDEPTANLDIATRREITRTLAGLKNAAETVIIATHDMQLVCEWADRVVVLAGGAVAADGGRDDIFASQALLEKAGIRPPEIFSMGRALDPRALCYTVEEFLRDFQGGNL